MATTENLKWVEISDFSPGIWGLKRNVPNAPVGSCTDDTFGCVAASDGALIPGPSRVTSMTQSMLGTGTRPTGENRMVALASHLVSPVHSQTGATTPKMWTLSTTGYPADLAICWGQFLDPASGSAWQYRTDTVLYKFWAASPPSTYTIQTLSSTAKLGGAAFDSPWTHGYADFCLSLETGLVATVHLYCSLQHFRGNAAPEVRSFPAEGSPTTDSTGTLTNPQLPALLVAHQGRVVSASNFGIFDYFGTSAGIMGANDLWYWDVRDAEGASPNFLFKPLEENQSGIQVLTSMSANELFLVKSMNGGAIIRGDLDNPLVVNMPNFHGTGGFSCKAVATPAGLVYGGRQGVFLWAGAEVTECISTQLDDDWAAAAFWSTDTIPSTDIARVGLNGQFSFVYPWVVVPNRWLWDTRSKGWWRLGPIDDAVQIFSTHTSFDGKIWCVANYVDGTQTTAVEIYDPATPEDEYTWVSRPLTMAQGRRVEIRAIDLVANGGAADSHTIQITLTDTAGNTDVCDFLLANNPTPLAMRSNANLQTDTVQLTVAVASGSSSDPAATIRAIRIGYVEGTQPRRT